MKPTLLPMLYASLLAAGIAGADDVRPIRFGPYLQQGVTLEGSPVSWRYVPPNGSYNFQAGWIEPIGFTPSSLFRGIYIEAQGNAMVSPYQSAFGTTFNLKPIRFLEFGLGYDRLIFPNTLVGFNPPDSVQDPDHWVPDLQSWQANKILQSDFSELAGAEAAGADVFTFQGSATVDIGRLQLHAGGFRSLWDVDVQDEEIIYEYSSNLLIRKRDRITSLYAQGFLDLEPYLNGWGFTLRGFTAREQYWHTQETKQDQNLVSAGFSGLRMGHNTDRRYRGLDGFVGFWTDHAQLDNLPGWQHLTLNLEWTWNIQILRLGED